MKIEGPYIGLNTEELSHKLLPGEAETCLNCDLSRGRLVKRFGWTLDASGAPASPVLGQHDYLKNDGTRLHIVKIAGSLYKKVSGALTAITSGGGFSTTDPASFRTIDNKVYIADPGSTPRVTDGSTVESVVVTPPPYAPDLAPAGVGPLRGTYDYKYTYYSTTWGLESPSSPSKDQAATSDEKTSWVEVQDGYVVLTNFVATSDTRFDKFRIYRRNLSTKGSEWYFVEEVADSTTVYQDHTPDRNLDPTSIAPLSYTQTLPAFRYLEVQSTVLFFAGADSDPTGLYYSPPGKPGAAVSRLQVPADGGGITGLLAVAGELAIFCRRSIWLLSGTSRANFYLRQVVPGIGSVGGHLIVPVTNASGTTVYFLSEQGFARWNLSAVDGELSSNIQTRVLDRNTMRDQHIVGVHDDQNNAVWWLYSGPGSASNDRMLLHFYANSDERPSWCPWTISGCSSLALIVDDSGVKNVSLGFASGLLGRYGGTSDNGAAIEWYWRTGRTAEGRGTKEKRLGEVAIEIVKQDQMGPLVVKLFREEETEGTEIMREPQDRTTIRGRIGERARRFAIEVGNNHADAPSEVVEIQVETTLAGRSM